MRGHSALWHCRSQAEPEGRAVTLTKEWGVPRLLFALLALVVAVNAFDLVRLFVVAGVLAYLANPAVGALERRLNGRRALAVLIVTVLILAPIGLALWRLLPLLAVDYRALAANGPELLADTLATV